LNRASSELPSPLDPGIVSRPGLLRALGPGMGIAMVVGNVIGSGIFFKPGGIAADAGSFPLIITAWILGGLICLGGALCFAELAVMLPRAGGLYVYLREAYGRPVAFLFGWTEFLFGKPASIGALSVVFIISFAKGINQEFSSTTTIAASLGLIAVMAWVNVIGVIWGGRVQAGTTLIKAGFLGLMALLPFALMMGGATVAIDSTNYASTFTPRESTLATQFAAVMLAVMWAYNGWHGITPVAEEVRDPQRNIPLSLFGGIGILIALYVAANLAYHGVMSMTEMAQADKQVAQEMIRKLLLPFGQWPAQAGVAVMSAVIMCSTFGAINSNMLNGPRVSFAMGRDDVFVRQLGRVHVNYRTPAVAICVQAVMSAVLVVGAGLYVQLGSDAGFDGEQAAALQSSDDPTTAETGSRVQPDAISGIFDKLTNFVVFSASIFYALAVAAVLVLRRKHGEWERAYRTWGYPVVPLLYLAFYGWFLTYVYLDKPQDSLVGLGLVALGVPAFYAWKSWAARHPETPASE
jgi:basic amino acid/polyamine antiporter, APA family